MDDVPNPTRVLAMQDGKEINARMLYAVCLVKTVVVRNPINAHAILAGMGHFAKLQSVINLVKMAVDV